MSRNGLKLAWRNLGKDRRSTFLNLIGLSIGLACSFLIYLWINDEQNIDKFNKNDNRLFQVMKTSPGADGTINTYEDTPGLLATSMVNELPEIEYSVAVQNARPGVISSLDKHIRATPQFVDKDFFNIFSYRTIEGSKVTALQDLYSIMLSDKLALKLFNTTKNITGRKIEWAGGDKFDGPYTIAGVFEAPPSNASDQFDILFSYALYISKNATDIAFWGNNSPRTYVLLKKGTDANGFNNKIKDYTKSKIRKIYGGNSDLIKWEGDLFIQKYSDKYLHNHYENGIQVGGRIYYARLFSIIAIFILVIACINFMNLSTAKASGRIKEVGIRKVIGAPRRSLILQYMAESILMSFLSLLIAGLIICLFLPKFREITGKDFQITLNLHYILVILFITLLTGIIAGSYPALYLSSFKPTLVLKGKLSTSAVESFIRKGLVTFQFTISTMLIIAVLVVYQQLNLIHTTNLGFNKDNVLYFTSEGRLKGDQEAFLTELKNLPGVADASSMSANMMGKYSIGGSGIDWNGEQPNEGVEFKGINMNYGMIEMLGMQMKEGRSFSDKSGSDTSSVIFNEAAIAAMRLKDPIGQLVTIWGHKKQIIGVVKDFHTESMYNKITPIFLRYAQNNGNIFVKIKAGAESKTVSQLENYYKQFNPGIPFEYKFLDDDYQALYTSEERVAILSRYFAGIAIIIACLGLFGLAAFTAQKRQKEISIRKVVGASTINVTALISRDFIKLILISILIAFPLSWWLMHEWLKSFAYRVQIYPITFVTVGASIILITLITISFQVIKVAIANPVKSLRSE